jgi:NADH-quinone oxidoreductase subunit C
MTLQNSSDTQLLYGQPMRIYANGSKVVFVTTQNYHELVSSLFNDGYNFASDLCAVDYLTNIQRSLPAELTPERFEVVLNLLSHGRKERIRVRALVNESNPSIPTVMDIYPGVENMEREAFDMYGIVFEGHPDLSRILMPEGWEGHPLRKDYAVGRVPVQFKETPQPR